MTRAYRVTAFGTSWVSYSLIAALTLIFSLKADYGPKTVVTLTSAFVASPNREGVWFAVPEAKETP